MSELVIRTEPILVGRETAAELLGVSRTYFNEQIAPDIPCVRRTGGKLLYRKRALEIWAERNETQGGRAA